MKPDPEFSNFRIGYMRRLIVNGVKELGEIAETIIKKNRPGHWKNELGDLCAFCIKPMLTLANMNFETACKLGKQRKADKMKNQKQ